MGQRLHEIITQKVMGRGLSDSANSVHEHKVSSLHISPATTKTQTYRPMYNVDAGYVEERGLRASEDAGSCQGIANDFIHEKTVPLVDDDHEIHGSTVEESWLRRAASDGRSHVVQVHITLFRALVFWIINTSSHPPALCADHFHPDCLANDGLQHSEQ